MKKITYDIIQLIGLLLIASGVYANWGGGVAAIVTGVILLVFPLVEIYLTRKR